MGQPPSPAVLLFSDKHSGSSISLGSAPMGTEADCTLVCFNKGLEHLPMLASAGAGQEVGGGGVLEPISCRYRGMTVHIQLVHFQRFLMKPLLTLGNII